MSTVDPMKKSSIYSIFGKHYGNKLYRLLDDCCDGVGSFCNTVKECLGISSTGDESLVLNQRGEWVSNNGDIQTLLSELPVYQSVANALANGAAYGSWFFNTLNNTVSKAWNFIQSYTAGISDIDFTNTTAGVDSWEAKFFAVPTVGFISNANIVDFSYTISFFDGINPRLNISANTSSTDVTFPILGNGMGVYYLSQVYNLDDGSILNITKVIRVDAVGNILSLVTAKGITINSINGLNINCTDNIDSINATVQYPTTWIGLTEFPPTNPPVVLGIGNILNTSIPINVEFIGFILDISTDYPEVTLPFQLGALSKISIQ